eukprot:TRINITY_DN8032_c0_g1_i7.p7 TRINITY_DN8032_c0_g1~~TRINITY_DN8032_c0_g1_i7.p7  ORF type:complete len:165 (+),score=15.72 TRINITY_DN8032_c0_g1_i7:5605-6099(+)
MALVNATQPPPKASGTAALATLARTVSGDLLARSPVKMGTRLTRLVSVTRASLVRTATFLALEKHRTTSAVHMAFVMMAMPGPGCALAMTTITNQIVLFAASPLSAIRRQNHTDSATPSPELANVRTTALAAGMVRFATNVRSIIGAPAVRNLARATITAPVTR